MSGIIGWVIIIWIIVVSVKGSQKKEKTSNTASRPNVAAGKPQMRSKIEETVKKGYQTVTEQAQKYAASSGQEEMKRRLTEKYARYPQKKPDILARASASVAEDFEENPRSQPMQEVMRKVPQFQPVQESMEGMVQPQIMQAVKILVQVDLHKIYDIPQMPQESELMKMVSDILAKGMDTETAFARDFVAEGLDMINETV